MIKNTFALLIAVLAFGFGFGASAQQVQQQDATVTVEATTNEVTVPATPVQQTVNKRVAVPTKKTKPNPNVRYTTRKVTETTGYTVTIPPQTVKAQVDMSQFQAQMNNTVAPLADAYNDLGLRVDKLEANQGAIVQSINTLNANDRVLGGRITALEQYTVGANQNFQRLDERLTVQENRKDKTRDWLDYVNFGMNIFNTGMNIYQSVQISNLKRNQQTIINNNNNNGGGNNQCWQNGKWVCGGGGPPICKRQGNGLWAGWNDKRCYNQPVGGDCTVRGNCNIPGQNNNPGGPNPVANGCSPGIFGTRCNVNNGNFPNSSVNGGGTYNNPSSNSDNYNNNNNGGGRYNTPRQNPTSNTNNNGGTIRIM